MRITREMMLMEFAHVAAKRGTCGRLAVGAIIARDGRPISIGYVGPLPGVMHCEEYGCDVTQPCTRTVHAELNAINFAIRQEIAIEGADMFTTDSPCPNCAEQIVHRGINRVFFDREYRVTSGIEHLLTEGVEVHRILVNGITRRYFL